MGNFIKTDEKEKSFKRKGIDTYMETKKEFPVWFDKGIYISREQLQSVLVGENVVIVRYNSHMSGEASIFRIHKKYDNDYRYFFIIERFNMFLLGDSIKHLKNMIGVIYDNLVEGESELQILEHIKEYHKFINTF